MQFIPARKPPGPGGHIKMLILQGHHLTQQDLAKALHVDRKTINSIINGRSGVTAEMALKLGKVTNTDPEFWLNAQRSVDLWEATQKVNLDDYAPLAGLNPI